MANAIKQFFDENGYYVARGVFSPAELHELETDFDHIVSQLLASGEDVNAKWAGEQIKKIESDDTVVVHTHCVHLYSAAWHRAILQKKFLDIVEAILGPDIILNHTKLFQKPPEKGAPFPMHQDWQYFPTVKDTMMAGIIHVSRSTEAMGCFRIYPGSHKLGRVPDTSGAKASPFLDQYPLEKSTPLTANPGDVVFFHYCMIHGSQPNRSSEARKTVLVQVHAGDDRVEEGYASEGLVLRGWNYHMGREAANFAASRPAFAAKG